MVPKIMNIPVSNLDEWLLLDKLLSQALELEEAERGLWLNALSLEQPEVAARIVRLLALADADGALEAVLQNPMPPGALMDLTGVEAGARFGNWVIQRNLGLGGMSEVYLARRQLEQGEQFAALKLISVRTNRTELLAKFIQEAAILSQLNDARIARLIDAGRAEDGRPWLAMEYVDGDPIDIGCDRRGLSVSQRVGLLIEVALAVDHAHRHLVVHRDIKPGNVMLSVDGVQVRLLDFGIAKVIAANDQDQANATQAYTMRFASPEQLSGGQVSTASDVYQLGMLLYLLLTGLRPFHRVEQNPVAILVAMQEGASAPSLAVLAHPDRQLERCGVRAPRLSAILRGDLDTIVLKAMAGEPQRRYLSARELAEDLIRWHNGEAISARPDAWYRMHKRIRKHWVAVTAVSVCLVLIIAYALTVTWQRQALQLERDAARKALARAEATRRFLVRVIGTANPTGSETGSRDIKEALVEASGAVEEEFRHQPDVAAETYKELGLVFQGMEDAVNAERAFRRSLELAPFGAEHAPNSTAIGSLAIALAELGRAQEGKELLERNIDSVKSHYGEISDEHIHLLIATARVEQALAAFADDRKAREAAILSVLQYALGLHNTLHPVGDNANGPDIEGVRSDLEGSIGATYVRAGNAEQAVPFIRRHYQQQLRMHGPNAARTLASRMNLATTLQKLKYFTESGLLLTGMVDELRREYGDKPNKMIAFALGALGNQSQLTGAYDASASYWAQAEMEAAGAMGADHPWLATARYRRAEALASGGHAQQAIVLLEGIVRIKGRSDDLVERAQTLLAKIRADRVD